MIGKDKKKPTPIDAAAAIEARESERLVSGERGKFKLGGQKRQSPAGAKGFLLVSAVAVACVVGVFVVKAALPDKKKADKPAAERVVKNPNKGFKAAALGQGEGGGPPATTLEVEPTAEGASVDLAGGPAPAGAPIQPIPVGGRAQSTGAASGLAADPQVGAQYGNYPSSSGMNTSRPPRQPTAAELLKMRRLTGEFGSERQGMPVSYAPPVQAQQAPAAAGGSNSASGPLADALKPMRLSAESAANLGNRDFLLTKGAMLDCVLDTRIESTVPGMTSCHLTRDVYSANGRVVLLDRGSKVVGFYQGGVRQGERRIFVQWSRVETPKGVVINLDSPGTGPLGEGGVDGFIDTHFGARFGGAILLSLINDLGDYFANKSREQTVTFSNSQSAGQELARTTLQNSINIPPTLYKNQGARLSIFVARDLSFEKVYGLAPVRR